MYPCNWILSLVFLVLYGIIRAMYIEVVPNRKSPPAILLRQAYREDGKVKKRTLANLTDWPKELIEGFRALLKGGKVVAARARRGGAGNIAGDRLGPRPRTARQSPPRPGHRHGREPADRAGLEAGDGARARSGDRHLQPRRGAGLAGCRRRRALRRLGLAAATAAGHREVPGQEAPRRRRAGPLRRHLELPRGPLLPPGQARLQPRRQEGQAADRLWPAVRRRRLPGGGRSVRRRHRRSQDP